MKIKKVVSLAYFDKSGKFRNFINVSDGIFGKIRFVGIGLICTNIQFGGLMFKNKKVVTLCVKKGGGVLWQCKTSNNFLNFERKPTKFDI